MARFNPSGGLYSLQTLKSGGEEDVNEIIFDKTGNIYLGGTFEKEVSIGSSTMKGAEGKNIFIAKLLPSLELENYHVINSPNSIDFGAMNIDQNGKIVVCGSYSGTLAAGNVRHNSTGMLDGFAVCYAPDGPTTFTKNFGTEQTDQVNSIQFMPNGSIIILGQTSTGFESRTGKLFHLDSEGEILDTKMWESSPNTTFTSVLPTDGNKVLINGRFHEHAEFSDKMVNASQGSAYLLQHDLKDGEKWAVSAEGYFSGLPVKIALNHKLDSYIILLNKSATTMEKSAIYLANIDHGSRLIWEMQAGEAEMNENYKDQKFVDFKGKLLRGLNTLHPVKEEPVKLLDENGNVVETTVTDDYGDFIFHQLNIKNEYNITAESLVRENQEPVYLANQFGKILGEMGTEGAGFKFKVLPNMLNEIALQEEKDVELEVSRFLAGSEKEAVIELDIFYHEGQFEIPYEYKLQLNDIAKSIRSKPNLKLEINSYTDAKGDEKTNLQLSQKRANEIVAYLVKRKVPSANLSAKGFGESRLINRCKDGVTDCSEAEHQANRKTELRLTKP